MAASKFSGLFNANAFAYGVNPTVPALVVYTPNTGTGANVVALAQGYAVAEDGTVFFPLNTNAPVTIGVGVNLETVTPTAVNNGYGVVYGTASLSATFANIHGIGDLIASGTFGLQEALNAASAAGGGTVVIDGRWTLNGGTNAMIQAATIPGTVVIQDNRSGGAGGFTTVNVTNAQVKTLFSVGLQVLAAPGAGNAIEIVSMVVENRFVTAAFAAGGAIQLSYGSGVTTPASATIAANFLTGPVANQIIGVAGSIASALSSLVLNTAVRLAAATADFTTGGGNLVVHITYRVHTGF